MIKPEKFWKRVQIGGLEECWPWIGKRQHFGHGSLQINLDCKQAHRVAFELAREPIPKGKWICHHCDNPPCCNPIHLYIGDATSNGADASKRKRYPTRTGEFAANAILTNEQARNIKAEYVPHKITQKMLAQKYSVSESTINWIVNGKHFREV